MAYRGEQILDKTPRYIEVAAISSCSRNQLLLGIYYITHPPSLKNVIFLLIPLALTDAC